MAALEVGITFWHYVMVIAYWGQGVEYDYWCQNCPYSLLRYNL